MNGTSGEMILEPSVARTLSVWWAWSWRYMLFSLAASFVLALPKLGFIMLLGGTQRAAEVASQILAFATFAAGQVYTLWNLFDKRFRDFELRLEETSVGDAAPATFAYFAPTLKHATEVWWAWFWRSVLWMLGLSFGLGLLLGVLGASYLVTQANSVVLVMLIWLAVSAFVLHTILGMTFSHFKLRLVPTAPSNTETFQIR
ncbi:MAG TPA: hypothetical protein VGR03_05205 [Candidatus Acidoferrum sp.]|nr:hypothetical protein [Candidatus Acidoferrum sp.]